MEGAVGWVEPQDLARRSLRNGAHARAVTVTDPQGRKTRARPTKCAGNMTYDQPPTRIPNTSEGRTCCFKLGPRFRPRGLRRSQSAPPGPTHDQPHSRRNSLRNAESVSAVMGWRGNVSVAACRRPSPGRTNMSASPAKRLDSGRHAGATASMTPSSASTPTSWETQDTSGGSRHPDVGPAEPHSFHSHPKVRVSQCPS